MTQYHVVILAQGNQSRLPDLRIPKHLLELQGCNGTPIIIRTLCQLAMLEPYVKVEREEGFEYVTNMTISVVCANPLRYALEAVPGADILRHTKRVLRPLAVELGDPGNSSLKGIRRYLSACPDRDFLDTIDADQQVIVLLGDVVYSWSCLRAIFQMTHWNMGFVGTPDLSRSSGELFGVAWRGSSAHKTMLDLLDTALTKHPPFAEYQCGQMRRWLWEADELCGGQEYGDHVTARSRETMPAAWTPAGLPRSWYICINDYTDDVDTPADLRLLDGISHRAAIDDAKHGLHWRGE